MDSKDDISQYEMNEHLYEYSIDEHGFPIKEPLEKKSNIAIKPRALAALVALLTVGLLLILLLLIILVGMTGSLLLNTFKDVDYGPTISPLTSTSCNCTSSGSPANSQSALVLQQVLEMMQNISEHFMMHSMNNSDNIDAIKQLSQTSASQLNNVVTILSDVKNSSTSTSGIINNVLLIAEDLLTLHNGSTLINSLQPVSCKDIKATLPNSPTGYYHVNSRNIYCNMEELCGSTGGWTRLGYLDMSDYTQNCPPDFTLRQSGGVRVCGRSSADTTGSCKSVKFTTNGISYSSICGRVVGYQYGSPDASRPSNQHNNIDSYYIDGVSITRGSPRQHVWSLMAGVYDSYLHILSNCPCSNNSQQNSTLQSFIGNNYFCESGNPNPSWGGLLYTVDPLWDGTGCGPFETQCCTAPGLPWFYRDYGNVSLTDYIELRTCCDQRVNDEDVTVAFYEIYVK